MISRATEKVSKNKHTRQIPRRGTTLDANIAGRDGTGPKSPSPSTTAASKSEVFLKFNYPELKDLGKHFLTISSGTAVFLLTFVDKIIGASPTPTLTVKICLVGLTISIASAGVGLFTNYISGAGASGAIILGIGKNFRAFTIATYVLYIQAGACLFLAFVLLAYQTLSL